MTFAADERLPFGGGADPGEDDHRPRCAGCGIPGATWRSRNPWTGGELLACDECWAESQASAAEDHQADE